MRHFIWGERVQVDSGSRFPDRGQHLEVGICREIRVDPGEQAYLGHISFAGKAGFLLQCFPVVAEGSLVLRLPPETAEGAEILADIGDVDVLVPDVGHRIAYLFLPQPVRGRKDMKDFLVA